MTNRPTSDGVMAITQRIEDSSRALHFATDQGAIVIRIEDVDVLRSFGEMMCDEADEWKEESNDHATDRVW
jgi:hypothetical protein